MSHAIEDFVERRVELLATVFLTSIDVEVFSIEFGGERTQIAKIISGDDRDRQERWFGIVPKGSVASLRTEGEANRLLNKNREFLRQYPFPVLALAFGMVGDDGYYAWYSEPDVSIEGLPMLATHRTLTCKRANRRALDSIVEQVTKWYDQFHKKMMHFS